MLEIYRKTGFKPEICVWELTLSCNFRCTHCGSSAGQARPDELTTEEALSLCDQLADLGNEVTTLSGGEPFMRPDWELIARRLIERGVRVNAITNAYLIDDRLADRIVDAGLFNVGISIDGLEDEHNRVRGKSDSYARCMEAIARLHQRELPTVVATHIHKGNLDTLGEMALRLIEQRVSRWQLQLGNPSGNMAHSQAVISPADLVEVVDRIAALIEEVEGRLQIDVGDNIGYYGPHEEILRGDDEQLPFWLGCAAGLKVIGIESSGEIKGCLSQPGDEFREGNVRHRTLREIWQDPDAFAYNRQFEPDMLEGGCAECQFGEICRAGCRWTAFSHAGSMFDNPYCYHRIKREHSTESESR